MKEKVLVPYPHYYLTEEDVDRMFKEMVKLMFLGIICNIEIEELFNNYSPQTKSEVLGFSQHSTKRCGDAVQNKTEGIL